MFDDFLSFLEGTIVSLESWQTVLFIVFGMLIGVMAGLIIAQFVLPIDVGDGWGSATGSIIGVCGAFMAARASFVWQEVSKRKEIQRPFSDRYEHSLQKIKEARDIVSPNVPFLKEIGEKVGLVENIKSNREPRIRVARLLARGEDQRSLISGPSTDDLRKEKELVAEENEKLEVLWQVANDHEFKNANKCISDAIESLSWVKNNLQETLVPSQIVLIGSILSRLGKVHGILEFSSNVILEREYWQMGREFRGDIICQALVDSLPDFLPGIENVLVEMKSLPKLN